MSQIEQSAEPTATSAREVVEPSGDNTEFVFFSGKGGVGKSTVSCATATWLADNDYNTLLVTTDPAPNLSDIFGQTIGHEVTGIDGVDNLSTIEIDPDTAAEEYRQETIEPMRELLDDEAIKTVEEQLNSPCVEEIAAFDNFVDFVDCPSRRLVPTRVDTWGVDIERAFEYPRRAGFRQLVDPLATRQLATVFLLGDCGRRVVGSLADCFEHVLHPRQRDRRLLP